MAGLKYGLPFAHPHPDILKRYRELEAKLLQLVQMGTGQSILHGNLTRRVTF